MQSWQDRTEVENEVPLAFVRIIFVRIIFVRIIEEAS